MLVCDFRALSHIQKETCGYTRTGNPSPPGFEGSKSLGYLGFRRLLQVSVFLCELKVVIEYTESCKNVSHNRLFDFFAGSPSSADPASIDACSRTNVSATITIIRLLFAYTHTHLKKPTEADIHKTRLTIVI